MMIKHNKLIFLLFLGLTLFGLSSCGQDFNSSSSDQVQYGSGLDASTPLGGAYNVMKERCFQCHSAWGNYTTNQAWIDSRLIVARDWNNSILRNSLKNFSGDMPPSPNSALTSEEVNKLQVWVNGLP